VLVLLIIKSKQKLSNMTTNMGILDPVQILEFSTCFLLLK
jgi:hypothetical protein